MIFNFIISFSAIKTKEIKGILLSKSDNMHLPGATIVVDFNELKRIGITDKTYGTVTDLDGRFIISIPENVKTFNCSYIGCQTIKVDIVEGKDFYTLYLEEDTKTLEDIIVTGYSSIEKRRLTAAVSKIEAKNLTQGGVMSVESMLQGQLAGVSTTPTSGAPGAAMKIRIRGISSLKGTQDPLWVVDGIPLEGNSLPDMSDENVEQLYSSSIAGLNPSDIKDITVLKDAAATAIYGARAACGVIVITTKKGDKGKMQINYSNKTSYTFRENIDRLNLMNSNQKVDLELSLLGSEYDFRESKSSVYSIINKYNAVNTYKLSGFNSLPSGAQNEINALRNTNTDWNDILFRSAVNQDNSLSFSGGGENYNYYVSLGYYDEKGTTEGVSVKRYNITSKVDFNITKNFKLEVGNFANQRENNSFLTATNSLTNPIYYSRRANPYQQIRNSDGDYIYDENIQYGDEVCDFNAIEEQNNTTNNMVEKSLTTNINLEYGFLKSFKLSSQLGIQNDVQTTEKISDNDSYATRRELQRSERKNVPFLPIGGIYKSYDNKLFQWTWKNMLKYSNTFMKKNEIDIMLGSELRKVYNDSKSSAAYGYDRLTDTSIPVVYPEISDARYFPVFTKSYSENAYVSAFSNFTYTYNNKYTLGGSIRFDGSDVFGVDAKYRYLPLYSLSGMWRASQENFMKPLSKYISNLTFRASYGLQGNIDKSTTAFVVGERDRYTILNKTENGIDITTLPNDKLRWEKTQTYNFGLSLGLFDRVNIDFDYYRRLATDQIGSRSLALETGFSSVQINWAEMENKGYELNISSINIKTKDFKWLTNFNIAYNSNEILKYSAPENETSPSIKTGYPYGAVYALPSAGLDSKGYPMLYKNGQKVTIADYFNYKTGLAGSIASQLSAKEQRDLYDYQGTTEPLYSGGITNTFSYRNFTLYVSCVFNLGQMAVVKPYYSITAYDRGLNANSKILDRWTSSNPSSSYPRLITEKTENGTRQAEFRAYDEYRLYNKFDNWVKDASYLRVNSVKLSYDFPKNIISKVLVKNLQLSFETRNLFVIASDYEDYLDPETMGNEYAQPMPLIMTMELNVTF